MDKRQLATRLFERTGIKVMEDDPAFLLVDLNLLLLEREADRVTEAMTQSAERLQATASQRADEFVTVANEALGLFTERTREIKTVVEQLRCKGGGAAEMPPPYSAETVSNSRLQQRSSWLWLVPIVYASGLLSGVLLAALLGQQ